MTCMTYYERDSKNFKIGLPYSTYNESILNTISICRTIVINDIIRSNRAYLVRIRLYQSLLMTLLYI